jgi:DNA gyrase inhibitor GyrI
MKHTRPLRVIASEFEGTPGEIVGHFEEIYAWARGRGLCTGEREPSGRVNLPWTATLHDAEDTTPDAARRIELWMPIDGAGPTQGPYAVKDMTHVNVAFMIHKGPMAKFEESIEQLFTWATEKELQFQGRLHRRVFIRGVDAHPEDPDWEAEIQIPLLAAPSS